MLLVEYRGRLGDVKKTNLDAFVRSATRISDKTDLDEAQTRVSSVLDRMATIFKARDGLLGSQGRIVVYYWIFREATTESDYGLSTISRQFRSRAKEESGVGAVDKDSGPGRPRAANL